MRQATDGEVAVLREGISAVSTDIESTPLMDIRYVLSDESIQIVQRYVQLI